MVIDYPEIIVIDYSNPTLIHSTGRMSSNSDADLENDPHEILNRSPPRFQAFSVRRVEHRVSSYIYAQFMRGLSRCAFRSCDTSTSSNLDEFCSQHKFQFESSCCSKPLRERGDCGRCVSELANVALENAPEGDFQRQERCLYKSCWNLLTLPVWWRT